MTLVKETPVAYVPVAPLSSIIRPLHIESVSDLTEVLDATTKGTHNTFKKNL